MIYKEIKPDPVLASYIDAYWTVSGDGKKVTTERIMPDGCVDIILNFGEECMTDNGSFRIENEKSYMVGTMTQFKITNISPETKLLGIRFKPAGFSAFYKFSSFNEIKNGTIEFEKSLSPDWKKAKQATIPYLNQFFTGKFIQPKHKLQSIITDIEDHKGQIIVTELAKRNFITIRQLERNFRQYIGATPKEFINFIRYRFVLPVLQHKERSLMDIALDFGYYDHAHLANEVKRYSGMAPSRF